ncbi:MAG: Aspartokinase [Nitrosopumilales archaeon]|nr:MAG: Aspartokinase [Nitrosopumilales archaeon]
MTKLVVAKFGGSAIGADGLSIPIIIQRINSLKKDAKVLAVFSAPHTIQDGKTKSLTDLVLELGNKAEKGEDVNLQGVKSSYDKILELVSSEYSGDCKMTIDSFLEKSQKALDDAKQKREFAEEIRSRTLAYSGEILMSHVMNYILKSQGIKSEALEMETWPIITDNNIESTNFLVSESSQRVGELENLLNENEVVCIGGFIGKTTDGVITTYERGGSDRTAADLAILFHKKYDTKIDFEKDNSVVSADPKVVTEELGEIKRLSYNEARLAGMFGMKILDPIAIKEIVEHGVDVPIIITDMKNPEKITTIERNPKNENGNPLKIVAGKKNCAILRIETEFVHRLVESLKNDRRYREYITLSPFVKDGIEFNRILFLDGDYVKRNEKYILGFDSLATITYNRGVITLIGDEMWRVQQIASKSSAKIGEAGLNILNMDAQEETSRIIIVIEDSGNNIEKAIRAVHQERSKIKFI